MQSAEPGLVGRDVELAALRASLATDAPVVLAGEAGIGKTALARAATAASGRRLYEGGGFATLAWQPYLALRRAAQRPLGGEPAQVAAVIERLVGPEVLFVDDLQWADRETRAVVELLAGRVAFVGAVREGDTGTATAMSLAARIGAGVVSVRGLDREAAAELAAWRRPDLPPEAIERLIRRSGGNPLLLEELASLGRPSRSLEQAIMRQLGPLEAEDRAILELLALAQRPLSQAALGAAGARLTASGLVRAVRDGLEVRHALIAEAIVAGLDGDGRAARHRRLARLIDEPAEVARHLLAGGRPKAASRHAQAALESTSEPRDRAALLVVAATATTGASGEKLRMAAARQLQTIGDDEGAVRMLEPSMTGDDDLLALRAAVLAESLSRLGRVVEAWDVLMAAAALRPEPRGEGAIALATSRAVALANTHGRLADGIGVLEATVALRSTAGRPLQVRGLLATLRMRSGAAHQLEELERVWIESVRAGDWGTAASTAMNLSAGLLIERGAAAALAFTVDAAGQCFELGLVSRAVALRAEAVQIALFAGDLRAAVMLADGLIEEPSSPRTRSRLLSVRGLALAWLGRFDAAAASLEEAEGLASPDFEGLGEVHHGRAELALWNGRPELAVAEAAAAIELPAVSDANYIFPGITRSWAEVELGHAPTPLPDAPELRILAGAAPEQRALAALARDDSESALAAFDEAAAAWAGYHRPRELVCRWAAGDAARRAGRIDVATARLEASLDEAATVGLEPLANRIRRSLRLAGARVRIASSAAGPSVVGLTTRERELIGLVERGLTNVEIARRLGLGRPTVARILASAMSKAGVGSRAQLAARELA
ncbi:MAG: hypothetical protein HYX57_10160 [Chloroflexi bacterium]|nr:hypothetical protein [Chloroflexota bacterium]